MNVFWKSLGKSLLPRESFRDSLRVRFYEEATNEDFNWFQNLKKRIPLPFSGLVFRKSDYEIVKERKGFFFDLSLPEKFLRWMFGFTAIVMLAVSPFLSYFWGEEISAMEISYVQNIEGDVFIEDQMGEKLRLENFSEITSGKTLFTGDGAFLEIRFFEGSLVRLDENTILKIDQIFPHQLFSSSGQVEVFLETGRIWVKTYQKAEDGFGIVVKSPELILSPTSATFDFSRTNGKDLLRVFSRSVNIIAYGVEEHGEYSISFMESLFFSPFESPIFSQVSLEEKSTEKWIQKNLALDEYYHEEFLENVRQKQKKEIMDSGDAFSFFSLRVSPEDQVHSVFSMLNNVILLLEAGESQDAKESLHDMDIVLSSLDTVGNEDTLKKIKTGLLISSSRISEVGKDSSALEVKDDIQRKQEEILVDSLLITTTEESSLAERVPSNFREKESQKVSSVVRSFNDQVNVYTMEQGRKNQAIFLLKHISAKPENLRLLRAIMESAPSDVKELVKIRYKEVLDETKKQRIKEEEALKISKKNVSPIQYKKEDPLTSFPLSD